MWLFSHAQLYLRNYYSVVEHSTAQQQHWTSVVARGRLKIIRSCPTENVCYFNSNLFWPPSTSPTTLRWELSITSCFFCILLSINFSAVLSLSLRKNDDVLVVFCLLCVKPRAPTDSSCLACADLIGSNTKMTHLSRVIRSWATNTNSEKKNLKYLRAKYKLYPSVWENVGALQREDIFCTFSFFDTR